MTTDPKETLVRYLQNARDAMVWKLDGVSEYDVRRPMTPTGTNLLGLVQHLASVEFGYLGETFGRPGEHLRWHTEEADHNDDMWVIPEDSREDIIGLYGRAWRTVPRRSPPSTSTRRARCRGGPRSGVR